MLMVVTCRLYENIEVYYYTDDCFQLFTAQHILFPSSSAFTSYYFDLVLVSGFFETGSHRVALVGLELTISTRLPKCGSSYPAS